MLINKLILKLCYFNFSEIKKTKPNIRSFGMTMIREPIDRFISAYKYNLKKTENGTVISSWVDESKRIEIESGFEDFVDTCLTYGGWNHMARQLVGK